MIDENLLNKFNQIEDLPVSEEMLGAYLEGNLDSFESSQIDSLLSNDSQLSNFVDDISHDDISSILDNIEHKLYDSSHPAVISDIELPDSDDIISSSINEDLLGAVDLHEDLLGNQDVLYSGDSQDGFLKENFSQDDSFLGSDQSLDIDSQECDDMFNDDLIDI